MLQHLAATAKLALTNDVLFIGRGSSIEERIAREWNLSFTPIRVGGFRGLGAATQARNLLYFVRAIGQAQQAIVHFKPNVVLATGGYVSAPVIWAAWRRRVPVVIELPDLEPGWAIQSLWRLSRQVAVSFDQVLRFFPPGRATVTGYPVRAEFYRVTREQGRAHFGLDATGPVITIFGGSQGAHVLNESVRVNLRELLRMAQIIHICGMRDKPRLESERGALESELGARYRVYDYLREEMPLALAAADLVVARAGAATLGELPAVGAASVLVPGEFAHGHQEKNADFLAAHGAAIKLRQADLPRALVPTIAWLLQDGERLQAMRAAAKRLARPEAAARIGELLMG